MDIERPAQGNNQSQDGDDDVTELLPRHSLMSLETWFAPQLERWTRKIWTTMLEAGRGQMSTGPKMMRSMEKTKRMWSPTSKNGSSLRWSTTLEVNSCIDLPSWISHLQSRKGRKRGAAEGTLGTKKRVHTKSLLNSALAASCSSSSDKRPRQFRSSKITNMEGHKAWFWAIYAKHLSHGAILHEDHQTLRFCPKFSPVGSEKTGLLAS